jgi:hypothetical protein
MGYIYYLKLNDARIVELFLFVLFSFEFILFVHLLWCKHVIR